VVVVAPAVRPGPEAPAPAGRGRPSGWAAGAGWVGLALALAAARLPTYELWGDVRFTLGVQRVTALTGWSAAETWAHRPLTNRLLMAGLDHLTGGPYREQQLLGWGALGCGLVVAALHRRLRARWGALESVGLCAGLLVALLWTSPRSLLQPEWFALLTAVAAVAVAARPATTRSGEWAVAGLTGLWLTATVAMKLTTVGTAAAAWAVIVALCWGQQRRLVRLTGATLVLVPLVLAVEVLLVPHEGVWLREMSRLNPDPATLGWCLPFAAPEAACGLPELLANELVLSPALLLLPAAVVLLARATSGAGRVAVVLLPVVGVGTAVATTVWQAKWFGHHLAALGVLAGAWLGWALARRLRPTGRPPWALVVPALVAGPVLAALLSLPVAVRVSTAPRWLGLTAASGTALVAAGVAVAALVAALRVSAGPGVGSRWTSAEATGRRPAVAGVVLGALALAAVFVNPLLPRTGFSYDLQSAGTTATTQHATRAAQIALAARIHARIGADTPVVYLAFGERAYWLQNPTYCRYAAATFLQRSVWLPTRGLRGFAENLDCLDDPRAAYVVVESDWFRFDRTDPLVRQRLSAAFDCTRPVLQERSARVCPRR
jgi:hypothetical protein